MELLSEIFRFRRHLLTFTNPDGTTVPVKGHTWPVFSL